MPGYIEHTIVTDRQSIWTFTGEVGVVQKTIQLEVNIKKWQKPTSITFELKGLNENVKGHGYFNAQEIDWNHTNITGFLNLSAKGMLGPMVNSILRSYVPKTTVQLTEAVVLKMKQSQPVPL
ncbi:CoxG family protein [Virgibacillus sp. W0181]|uniref:CoxG family protein n=1 Tax=Virgibacillus sp. W0181 TaxID=3391581 RepID=UPI003F451C9E